MASQGSNRQSAAVLLSLVLLLLSHVFAYAPTGREAATATLIKDKIYFLGGDAGTATPTSDFFTLDVSAKFSTQAPPLTDLSTIVNNTVPSTFGCAAAGGPNNVTLVLYGGFTTPQDAPVLQMFNTTDNTWSFPPAANAGAPDRLRDLSCVTDSRGKFYVYGGRVGPTTGADAKNYPSNMSIFDTIGLSWSTGQSAGGPGPRNDYATAILSDGRIVYIGGRVNAAFTDMTQIYVYDPKAGIWSLKTATGQIPSVRAGATAVATRDGRVIVYGGAQSRNQAWASPDVAVLDTSTTPFTWSQPTAPALNPIPQRFFHNAVLVGSYMIVAFGKDLNGGVVSPDIYLLDIGNYTWSTTFDPSYVAPIPSPNTMQPSPTPPGAPVYGDPSGPFSVGTLIAVAACAAAALAGVGLFTIAVLAYRWRKRIQTTASVNPWTANNVDTGRHGTDEVTGRPNPTPEEGAGGAHGAVDAERATYGTDELQRV